MGKAVSSLCASCGSAASFDKDGVTITAVTDSFAAGHVDIDGLFEKSGFC
jgi:hypothetical protein